MKKKLVLLLFLSTLIFGAGNDYDYKMITQLPAMTYQNLTITYITGGVCQTGFSDIDSLNKVYNCRNVYKLSRSSHPAADDVYIFEFIEGNMPAIASLYQNLSRINIAEPNYLLEVGEILINDPDIALDAGLQQMDGEAAWDYEGGAPGIIIQILDTGIDVEHPELGGNLWQNLGEDLDGDGRVIVQDVNGYWSYDSDDENGIDDDGNGYVDDFIGWDFFGDDNWLLHTPAGTPPYTWDHGTKVAGVTSAVGNNSLGSAGVAYGCKVMASRIGRGGSVYSHHAINAIIYGMANNISVVNMSWGGLSASGTLHNKIIDAYNDDIVFTAAAMNNTSSTPRYPAAWSEVIAVAAVNLDDTKQDISNWGTWVDISAPRYKTRPGYHPHLPEAHVIVQNSAGATSSASPFTAGLAGLILSKWPSKTPAEVLEIIQASSEDVDPENAGESWEGLMGAGRINPLHALAPPSVPTVFQITNKLSVGQNPHLSWVAPPDRDVDHYEIYLDYNGDGSFHKTGESTTTEYTDPGAIIGHPRYPQYDLYTYKCLAVDVTDQESIFSNTDMVRISGISKKSHKDDNVENPLVSAIGGAYPNPFNPMTIIPIAISDASFVSAKIYNITGVEVSDLVLGQILDAGYYEFDWSGKTNDGISLPSGLYLCKIIINSQVNDVIVTETLKLMYAK